MKILDPKALPTDHLTTADREGKRVYVYPSDVRGRFKSYRNVVQSLLIVVFLVLPWIKIGGHQSILLDFANRQFAVFGLTFWAHDAPMLVFVLGGAALSLVFVTALWGRAWCGWACPQTVFIENVFRRIERAIEGDAVERKRLDAGPWNGDRVWKKSLKWASFLAVTLIISHSFLAYFVGAESLGRLISGPPRENYGAFLFMAGFTALLLFDFGWFREQFCTVVCPYGRFQSLLMDKHSLVVTYDEKRQADCVNCFRCVQVCPTGIDIRRGLQLECIACTACIDACDDVMGRLKKPLGLIRYEQSKAIRPRTVIYFLLVVVVAAGLATTIARRSEVEMVLVRPQDVPYQDLGVLEGKQMFANRYRVELVNQTFKPLRVRLQSGNPEIEIAGALKEFELAAGKDLRTEVFFKFPKEILNHGKAEVEIRVLDERSRALRKEAVTLVGPYF